MYTTTSDADILTGIISIILVIVFFVKIFQIVNLLREQNDLLRKNLSANQPGTPTIKPHPAGANASFEEMFGRKTLED